MNASLMQMIAILVVVSVATGLFFAYRTYLAANSERRIRAMLEEFGLDPAIASNGAMPTVMREVRRQCRACSHKNVCNRWLDRGKEDPTDFCPNARVFEMLSR